MVPMNKPLYEQMDENNIKFRRRKLNVWNNDEFNPILEFGTKEDLFHFIKKSVGEFKNPIDVTINEDTGGVMYGLCVGWIEE